MVRARHILASLMLIWGLDLFMASAGIAVNGVPVMKKRLHTVTGAVTVPWGSTKEGNKKPERGWQSEYPIVLNARVKHYLQSFRGPGKYGFIEWLKRSGRYQQMIKRILREEGLPEELLYVAMVESGFDPRARSWVGATGMWQFRSATARRYGLVINRWIDERRDPVKSTRAAARFFKDLLKTFRDLHLAKAGYNAGTARIRKGLNRLEHKDFWTLAQTSYIAPETRNYVPKILAAIIVAKNPEAFGFTSVEYDPPLRYEEVPIPKSTALRKIASAAGVSVKVIRELNPELRRAKTPPNNPGYRIKVPLKTGEKVARGFEVGEHLVQRSDTLEEVEKASEIISETQLAANALTDSNGNYDKKEIWITAGPEVFLSNPAEFDGVGGIQRTELSFITLPTTSSSATKKQDNMALIEKRPEARPSRAHAHPVVYSRSTSNLLLAFNLSVHRFTGLRPGATGDGFPHQGEYKPSKFLTVITSWLLCSNGSNVYTPTIGIWPRIRTIVRPQTKTQPPSF